MVVLEGLQLETRVFSSRARSIRGDRLPSALQNSVLVKEVSTEDRVFLRFCSLLVADGKLFSERGI